MKFSTFFIAWSKILWCGPNFWEVSSQNNQAAKTGRLFTARANQAAMSDFLTEWRGPLSSCQMYKSGYPRLVIHHQYMPCLIGCWFPEPRTHSLIMKPVIFLMCLGSTLYTVILWKDQPLVAYAKKWDKLQEDRKDMKKEAAWWTHDSSRITQKINEREFWDWIQESKYSIIIMDKFLER